MCNAFFVHANDQYSICTYVGPGRQVALVHTMLILCTLQPYLDANVGLHVMALCMLGKCHVPLFVRLELSAAAEMCALLVICGGKT